MSSRDLFVFDLDGTLCDTLPDITRAVNGALLAVGRPPRAASEVRVFLGGGARELVGRAAGWDELDPRLDSLVERYRACYREALVQETRLYDGVEATLSRLGAPAAVLTNKPGPEARAILEALGMSARFVEIIGDGDGLPRKPDPTGLRAIIERAGARRTLYVGDSQVDADTAQRAEVDFAFVAWGYGTASGAIPVTRFEDLLLR